MTKITYTTHVTHPPVPQVPASTPPVRVLVSSTWRSGSTLLGEVLAAHPGVYYHYEPLMPYGLQQLGPTESIQVTGASFTLCL